MDHTPLILPTVIVFVVAALEWRSTRPVAWVALAAAFVLTVCVLRYPTLSATEIVDFASAHLAAPLALARIAGAGCFLYTVVRKIRGAGVPW